MKLNVMKAIASYFVFALGFLFALPAVSLANTGISTDITTAKATPATPVIWADDDKDEDKDKKDKKK